MAQAIYDGVDVVMLSAETAIEIIQKNSFNCRQDCIEIERDALYFESRKHRERVRVGVFNAITVTREVAEMVS